MQHFILEKCLKPLLAFVSLSMSGFIFPPRRSSAIDASSFPSAVSVAHTRHFALSTVSKEGGREASPASVPRASFSPTRRGWGGRGRPSYATRTFLRGEGGRAERRTDGRKDGGGWGYEYKVALLPSLPLVSRRKCLSFGVDLRTEGGVSGRRREEGGCGGAWVKRETPIVRCTRWEGRKTPHHLLPSVESKVRLA